MHMENLKTLERTLATFFTSAHFSFYLQVVWRADVFPLVFRRHLVNENGPVRFHQALRPEEVKRPLVLHPSDELHRGVGLNVTSDNARQTARDVLRGLGVHHPSRVWKAKETIKVRCLGSKQVSRSPILFCWLSQSGFSLKSMFSTNAQSRFASVVFDS